MTLQELEAKITALEAKIEMLKDIEDIKTLMWNYTYSLDYRQLDKILDCFTEDAQMEVRVRGGLPKNPFAGKYSDKKAIEKLYVSIVEQYPKERDRFVGSHLLHNAVINVKGNEATGTFYLLNPRSPSQGEQPNWTQGRYENEFEKVRGKED